MSKLITLDKDYNIKLNSEINKCLNPDYIYLPIKIPKIELKKNQKVYKDTEIFEGVYNPVSGYVNGLKDFLNNDDKPLKCLTIANDFEEFSKNKNISRKKITTIEKAEFLNNLPNLNLKQRFSKEFQHVIISGIDDEPYVANATFIQKNYPKEILELLETIHKLFNVNITLALKNTDSEAINAYENWWGTYQEITLKLVPDVYLIGKERFLTEELNIKDNYLYLTIPEVYNIWYKLKKNKVNTLKLLTISGDAIKNPQVVLVKLGTSLDWLIKKAVLFNTSNYDIYLNGTMQGHIITDLTKYLVLDITDSIIIMKKQFNPPKKCISCGACLDICPINANPYLAYLNQEKITCLNCGLCTYICPAYIELRKYLKKGDKDA